jgi:hypothetical protein
VLLSWSGSMFEYLMPMLVMPTYEHTLLDQTAQGAVARQIEYGRQRGVPWGISESGYNTVDAQLNYQYRAFGVPGLGLKRGLAEDLVVAPYATVMALMVAPRPPAPTCSAWPPRALAGVRLLRGHRLHADAAAPRRERACVVRSFMAHHQGMSLLALAYLLLDRRCSGASSPTPVPGHAAAAAGAHSRPCLFHPPAELRGAAAAASPAPTPLRVIDHARHAGRPKCSCCPTAATT